MNPYNRPVYVNASIWDKEMADAFSLTEPLQNPNEFNIISTRMNPESVSTVFAVDGYSNACGTGKRNLCLHKCDVLHNNVACNVLPTKKMRNACFEMKSRNRNTCKGKCPSADQACIEEKNNPMTDSASETIPVVPNSTPAPDTTPVKTPTASPAVSTGGATDSGSGNSAMKFINNMSMTEKALIGGGIIIGFGLLMYGMTSATKKPMPARYGMR